MWIHADCRHKKKFETMPNGNCNLYRTQDSKYNHPDGHCNRNLRVAHVNVIMAPMLCLQCFREAEEQISSIFDEQINIHEQDMANVILELMEVADSRRQESGERLVEHFLEQMESIKEGRKSAIEGFRAKQGVWADG